MWLIRGLPTTFPQISGALPVCVKDLLSLTYLVLRCSQEECGGYIILHLQGQPLGQRFPLMLSRKSISGANVDPEPVLLQVCDSVRYQTLDAAAHVHFQPHLLVAHRQKQFGVKQSHSDAVNIFWALTAPEGGAHPVLETYTGGKK